MGDSRRLNWKEGLRDRILGSFPGRTPADITVLDAGIDLKPDMIEAAKVLAQEEGVVCDFRVMDAESLAFEDQQFDAVVSRNLTWTLPHPVQAYKEWMRVLKPGGVLINIDANYGAEDTTKMSDLPTDHAHHKLGYSVLSENNAIKRQLSISFQKRPAWDVDTLEEADVKKVSVDFRISDRVYLEKDQFYNPTLPSLYV